MEKQKEEHRITVKIADAPAYKLAVKESEESFYRQVIANINANVDKLRYSANADSSEVALAKVTLYYATMLYRQTKTINDREKLLDDFEARIDALLEGTD